MAGVLPELEALGELLEAREEWQQDASGVRSRMLVILGAVADRYEAQGKSRTRSIILNWDCSCHCVLRACLRRCSSICLQEFLTCCRALQAALLFKTPGDLCDSSASCTSLCIVFYCLAGHKASACALLEAAISQYEETIGLRSSAVTSAFRRAEQLLASLPDEERQKAGLHLSQQNHHRPESLQAVLPADLHVACAGCITFMYSSEGFKVCLLKGLLITCTAKAYQANMLLPRRHNKVHSLTVADMNSNLRR